MAQGLVDDLTAAFYRPTLEAEGVTDPDRFAILYDESALVVRPDRSKDAKEAHDRGVLSDKALREATDFTEGDAPSEEERRVWISIRSRDPQFAVSGVASGATTQAEQTDEGVPAEANRTPGDVDPGPPPEPDEEGNPQNGDVSASAWKVIGATEVALVRARECAGNRVRNLAKRDPAVLREIEMVAAKDVCATLGRDRVRALGATSERDLIAGSRTLIIAALATWGLADNVVRLVVDHVEQQAARTLYDEHPPPLPQAFRNYVTGALTAAK
jgi:hypothetical protein